MMTLVTHTSVRAGTEPAWEAAMRDRRDAATSQPGFVRGQLLIPLPAAHKRVISGTWETRAAWDARHNETAFQETRTRLEGLEAEPNQQ